MTTTTKHIDATTTTLCHDNERGGQAYPFLPADLRWQIISRPFADGDDAESLAHILDAPTPTLRWVKDNKVLDLHVPGMDTKTFLARSGLRLTMARGGYTLSKRLSRLMRPYRFWDFFTAEEVTIQYSPELDPALWDGSGQVSRAFIRRLAARLGERLTPRQRRELLASGRFEVTTAHAGGQDKGHVMVVDDLDADLRFPAGSAKPEVALTDGRLFVGLQPVHSRDTMRLDIQSLINLHPFFRPEQLLAWTGLEAALFLDGIRSGRLAEMLDRLTAAETAADLASLADWHVGEYIASGGRLMWFAGLVQAVGRQHLVRLGHGRRALRLPVPGGRYYIAPAAVGGRSVAPGEVALDPKQATAWVSDADWCDHIVAVLGGCDGDDAVWTVPFRDAAANGAVRLLLWRSPNQVGEYVLLTPAAGSHRPQWRTADGRALPLPRLDSRRLPPRVDRVARTYGELPAGDGTLDRRDAYTIAALDGAIRQAAANRGVLGAHCNALMVCQAVYGRLPDHLPAPLEAVIDASVKDGRDLTPVRAWNEMALRRMVDHGRSNPRRALPVALLDRLPPWLRTQATVGGDGPAAHWLDVLTAGVARHKAQYQADLDALATEACPPPALFDHGRPWLHAGRGLRQVYSRALRGALGGRDAAAAKADDQALAAAFDAARTACEAYLSRWPAARRTDLLLGAAAALYAEGPRAGAPVGDGVLWQLGVARPGGGREPGIAQQMVAALRGIGLLGEPVWTRVGAVVVYADTPETPAPGVPVRFNGTWLNLLNAERRQAGRVPYGRMADVPPAERVRAKARIADYVCDRFRGMVLTTAVTAGERVVAYTPQGNLFGYVQRDHELAAVRHEQWRIAWAAADDGSVCAILEPAG